MAEDGPARVVTARTLLEFDQVGERRFRNRANQDNGVNAIFGGQPLAQALAAAQRTAPDWPAHSCTGYFLRGGALDQHVDYDVEVLRDGRRYAARRVLASQNGRPIFDLLCSFHDAEDGPSHQIDDVEPPAPDPESLPTMADVVRANPQQVSPKMTEVHAKFPIDLRIVDLEGLSLNASGQPRRAYWLRMPSAAGMDDARAHQCLLAFLSDYWFPAAAASPHQAPQRKLAAASLNHTLWFHAPARADEWLLWRTDGPWTGQGRGLVRGQIYNRAGVLVASATQEISMRWTD